LTPLEGHYWKYAAVSASYISPMFLNNIRVKLDIHLSVEDKIIKNYLYLSKLEAQMVTSKSSENLSLQLQKLEEKNHFHENPENLWKT
jgi:hypothetical protein